MQIAFEIKKIKKVQKHYQQGSNLLTGVLSAVLASVFCEMLIMTP